MTFSRLSWGVAALVLALAPMANAQGVTVQGGVYYNQQQGYQQQQPVYQQQQGYQQQQPVYQQQGYQQQQYVQQQQPQYVEDLPRLRFALTGGGGVGGGQFGTLFATGTVQLGIQYVF